MFIISILIVLASAINEFLSGVLFFSWDYSSIILLVVLCCFNFLYGAIKINLWILLYALAFMLAGAIGYLGSDNETNILSLVKLSIYFFNTLLMFSLFRNRVLFGRFLNQLVSLYLLIALIYIPLVVLANLGVSLDEVPFVKVYKDYGIVRIALIFNEPLLMAMNFSVAAMLSTYIRKKYQFATFILAGVLSLSLTGVVLVLFTLLVKFFGGKGRAKAVLLGVSSILICVLFLFFSLGDRFESILDLSDSSFRIRIASAAASFNIFVENPLFGVGYGNSRFIMDEYVSVFSEALNHVELKPGNAYLLMLSELGVFGFLLFIFPLVYSLINSMYGVGAVCLVFVYFLSAAIITQPILCLCLLLPWLLVSAKMKDV